MYTLPDLPYGYDQLGKYISQDTMILHHTKHHQAYVDKLNTVLANKSNFSHYTIEKLLSEINSLPQDIRTSVRNNAGGHYNHSNFWKWMSPLGGGEPKGDLLVNIISKYGSFQNFVDDFSSIALNLFGSGWVWLQPNLEIITSPNQDNPIMTGLDAPILGLDVWEHAYYIDYRNKRNDYISSWWNLVDWNHVASKTE